MTQDEIYSELTGIFRETFGDDQLQLQPQMSSDDIGEWDSHNHISLIVATELHFGVKFQTAELEGMRNVGELARCIERKVNARR